MTSEWSIAYQSGMSCFRNDSICARRRFNPLARCTVVSAIGVEKNRRRAARGSRKTARRKYTRRAAPKPVVARV